MNSKTYLHLTHWSVWLVTAVTNRRIVAGFNHGLESFFSCQSSQSRSFLPQQMLVSVSGFSECRYIFFFLPFYKVLLWLSQMLNLFLFDQVSQNLTSFCKTRQHVLWKLQIYLCIQKNKFVKVGKVIIILSPVSFGSVAKQMHCLHCACKILNPVHGALLWLKNCTPGSFFLLLFFLKQNTEGSDGFAACIKCEHWVLRLCCKWLKLLSNKSKSSTVHLFYSQRRQHV